MHIKYYPLFLLFIKQVQKKYLHFSTVKQPGLLQV